MSGIVGIVSLDGGPVDAPLLRRMTDSMAYRGPDRRDTWVDGRVGFGHTLLRTAPASDDERQPATLDGQAWITADARVDGRADLIRELESRGHADVRRAGDALLILHAYHAWGEDCVDRLLGDFAFAIWDGARRALFCARDRFGIKPFYYAVAGGAFVFSNTLDCVRLHPDVGDELNELAIADFLLFEINQDPAATVFVDVRRLAPAHCVTVAEGAPRVRRYWSVPTHARIRYTRSRDYVDHFTDLLRIAVGDRLPAGHVAVWMSGGLDSTSIAAVARRLISEMGRDAEVRAQTIVYDTLIPDEERQYARMAADALGIAVTWFVADDFSPLEEREQSSSWTPEPSGDPFLLMRTEQLKQAAALSRVVLCGTGGDEVLSGSHVTDLLGKMPLRELGADIVRSLAIHRRRPGLGVRSVVNAWLRRRPRRPPFPVWLNAGFADRADLRTRWDRVVAQQPSGGHPLRPRTHWRLTAAPWSWTFESWDPGVTGIPVEGRYPFLDLRLVDYLMAIPPLPWSIDKQILRVAMRGVLPDPVRLRNKVPLAGSPLREHFRKPGMDWLDRFEPTPELARWVVRTALPSLADAYDGEDPWLDLRPLCLDNWLRRARRRLNEEISDDHKVVRFQGRRAAREEALRNSPARDLRRHS